MSYLSPDCIHIIHFRESVFFRFRRTFTARQHRESVLFMFSPSQFSLFVCSFVCLFVTNYNHKYINMQIIVNNSSNLENKSNSELIK